MCISPGMTAFDLYHGWFYHGGALRLASTLGWGLQLLKADARRKQLREASDRLEQAWAQLASQTSVLPIRAHPALHGEGLPSYVLDWLDHDAPGEYWTSLDVSRRLDKIRVPALHISGWYDMFLRGSVDGFLALRKSAGSEFAREHQYLLAGPWVHIPWGDRIGAADFGPEALHRYGRDSAALVRSLAERFRRRSQGEPHVSPLRARGKSLARSGKFSARRRNTPSFCTAMAGRIRAKEMARFPRQARAPTNRATFLCTILKCPLSRREGRPPRAANSIRPRLELGNNLLVYSTEPLEKPLWVFGIPRVVLYCATSRAAMRISPQNLCAQGPTAPRNSFASESRGRAAYSRKGATPRIKFIRGIFASNLPHAVLLQGDRIRLEIASSAFPLYDRNPGSDVPSCRATSWDWRRSTQIVYPRTRVPSALYLPVSEAPE